MKIRNTFSLLFTAGIILTACGKDDPAPVNNNINDSTITVSVDSGKSQLGFAVTPSYYGTNAFNVSNSTTTYAFSQTTNGIRQVQVKAVEQNGNNARTVFLFMVFPQTASTSNGNISINFNNPPSDPYTAKLVLAYTQDTIQSPDYTSVSGNVVITRLTTKEVQGTFQGAVADTSGNVLNISGGTFEGRF